MGQKRAAKHSAASARGQRTIDFYKKFAIPTPRDGLSEDDKDAARIADNLCRTASNKHVTRSTQCIITSRQNEARAESVTREPPVKRRRVLSHVEIIVKPRPQVVPFASLPSPETTASPCGGSPDHDESGVAPVVVSEVPPRSDGRPRRAQRMSYAPIFTQMESPSDEEDVTNDDDLKQSKSRSQRSRRPAARDYDDDDDFFTVTVEDELSDDDSANDLEEEEGYSDSDESVEESSSESRTTKTKKKSLLNTPGVTVSVKKSTKKNMLSIVDRKQSKRGINDDLPPLSDASDIFEHLTSRGLEEGLREVVASLGSRPIRVATMCSGTESPLLALRMISDSLIASGLPDVVIEHVFSAEIEPYKQAYIERNFQPPIIFRDIVEITHSQDNTATTAYGAKVTIPDDIDIVVAGTACVDFSGLNRLKKGLEDHGESGDTFNAVLTYAMRYRPRVVILENIFGAPWDDMLAAYEANGYAAAGVLLDTKEYYLPQTRLRGYMVCIDRQAARLAEKDARGIVSKWQKLMTKLKRPVSSPVSDFLLPNDDSEVILSRDRIARQSVLDSTFRDTDWSACEERHKNYRLSQKLGNSRPYTSWEPSGTLVIYDYADRAWHKAQVERVWDFEDCSLLRKAYDYDVQFKTRIWDVSQNIDRYVDTAPFGISSCLTPKGNFFVTDRGGPLTFAESLGLQGIPTKNLIFTSETERQVQDLAGNAMSSTVIGAALISALISAKHVLQPIVATRNPQDASLLHSPVVEHIAAVEKLKKVESMIHDIEIDVAEMVDHARASARMCYCEGQVSMAEKPIQTCLDCGHKTCTGCGGKPTHRYHDLHEANRKTAESFIQRWRPLLPMVLSLHNPRCIEELLKQETASKSSNVSIKGYCKAVMEACSSEFKFSHFRRSLHWTVVYEASCARLVLTIDPQGPHWALFAVPDSNLAGNDPLRRFLKSPVGRSPIGENNLFSGNWEWRVPHDITFELDVSEQGARVPSWTARLNLPGEENRTISQKLCIKYVDKAGPKLDLDICGTYEHLKHCGTACEALYKKVNNENMRPLFLFLDPTRLGSGSDDSFVFSSDPERLQYDETRSIVAQLDCKWRPWNKKITSTVGKTDCRWIRDGGCSLHALQPKLGIYAHPGPTELLAHSCCTQSIALVQCDYKVLSGVANQFQGSHQIRSDNRLFFNAFAWALEPLRSYAAFDQEFTLPQEYTLTCNTCAPPLPETRWTLSKFSANSTPQMRPYEDPKSATTYEISLKNRPEIFVVQSCLENGRGSIKIGINHLALAQRAFAKLRKMTTSGFMSTSWTLDTRFSIKPLSLPRFHLRGNDPAQFFHVNLPATVQLWQKQMQSLAWMRNQEADEGKEFILEAVEEALLPHMGWRAEARSAASLKVRGGILADHPGFGKTITSLSLIYSEFQDFQNSHQRIIGSMKELPLAPGQSRPIKIAATLVICPKTLTRQWYDEVGRVLGSNFRRTTICIQDMADLKKYRIKSFKSARIILLNRELLSRASYLNRLAAFAGVPEPGDGSRKREFSAWLDLAIEEVHAHAEILERDGGAALAKVIKQKFRQHLQDNTLRSFAKSKRLKGKEYAKKGRSSNNDADADDDLMSTFKYEPKGKELESVVLFEMFQFNRIIIDEFSYVLSNAGGSMTSTTALKADKRWALSATPPLKDPYDVAQLARVIGINLSSGVNMPGLLSTKNLEAIQEDLTNVELFETFREAPSHIHLSRIHKLAQTFLNDFVRQNILQFGDFEYNDYVVPTTLQLDHSIVYNELSQQLNSQDMRIKRVKQASAQGQDREERIHESVKGIHLAEQALSNRATFFSPTEFGNGEIGLRALQRKREEERKSLRKKLEAAIYESQQMNAAHKGPEYPFEMWQEAVLPNNEIGDQEVTNEIKVMIDEAKLKHSNPKGRRNGGMAQTGNRPNGAFNTEELHIIDSTKKIPFLDQLRAKRTEVNQLSKKLTAASRSIRFVNNVQRLHDMRSKGKCIKKCDFETCLGKLDLSELNVSSVCGHVICNACFRTSQESVGNCGASGCKSPVQSFHLLGIRKMGHVGSSSVEADQGRKVATVVEILQQIQDYGQQAILFVREKNQIGLMKGVLDQNGISCVAIDTDTASRIEEFQKSRGQDMKTVIILNADDESAAGTNLTNANHVIFLSPLLQLDQYGYESQMAQAIGRVRRPGQKNDIFIYRMVALHTIDVDVLEHRERSNRILVEKKPTEIWARKPEDIDMVEGARDNTDTSFAADETSDKPERTQLIRDNDDLFKLVPKSLLLRRPESKGTVDIDGGAKVKGFEDFNALIKFSKAYTDE